MLKVQETQSYSQLHTKKVNFSEGRSSIHTMSGQKFNEPTVLKSPESRLSNNQSALQKSHAIVRDSNNVTRKSEFHAKFRSNFQDQQEIAEKSAVFERSHQSITNGEDDVKLPEITQTPVQVIKVNHYNVPIEDSPFKPSYEGFERPPVRLRKSAQSQNKNNKLEEQAPLKTEKPSPETGKSKKKHLLESIQKASDDLDQHGKETKILEGGAKNTRSAQNIIRVSKNDGRPNDPDEVMAKSGNPGLVSKQAAEKNVVAAVEDEQAAIKTRNFQPHINDNVLDDLDKGVIKIHSNAHLLQLMSQ